MEQKGKENKTKIFVSMALMEDFEPLLKNLLQLMREEIEKLEKCLEKERTEGATHEKENVDTKGDKASGSPDQMGAQA